MASFFSAFYIYIYFQYIRKNYFYAFECIERVFDYVKILTDPVVDIGRQVPAGW